ncbi:MAG: esterase/lipase family protein [Candidatus Binataceae bacterium]
MNPITIVRELGAAGALLVSYPLECLTLYNWPFPGANRREPVILAHGLGGNRTNLLGLAAFVRMAGFGDIGYFDYPVRQALEESAAQLAGMAARADRGAGVHLMGHSLGGTISRMASARMHAGAVRSLITLASPYSYTQCSPGEVAFFGDEDPIVRPPMRERLAQGAFKRVVILPNTAHLGVLYHQEVMQVTFGELRASRAAGE